jgi:hypothetical protein
MLDKQRNKKIEPTENQNHPTLALPEDFEVMTAAEAAKSQVPACYGDITPKQLAEVFREGGEATSTKPALTGKSGLSKHPKRH